RSKSEGAISDIGDIYMSEMNKQMQQKFDSVIMLRISQIQGIMRRTPAEECVYGEEMLAELETSASVRNFSFLGIYAEDGDCEVICGSPVEIVDEEAFWSSLAESGDCVTNGVSEEGERLLLLGCAAYYPMKGEKTSIALVAGIPMSYLEEVLVLDGDEALMYSHIIHRDGSFVVRSGEAYRDSYFERIKEEFQEYGDKTAEQYVLEMQAAIANNENYSGVVQVNGESRHMYCSPLENTQWYLVSVMPNGILDSAIANLGNQRSLTMLLSCGVVLAGIIFMFILYYRASRKQMAALKLAENEANRANKAKSEFLSNMSHDIRTPMNGIVGMTAIAMTNMEDTQKVQECLRKIALSSKHLLGLINDVLDMSKIESGKLSLNMDKLSLRDTMESIVNIVQPQIKSKNQHFDIFIQKIECEDVYCDNVRLNQVLINLLSNAVKFTPEGGRVNVYLSQEPSPVGENFVRCHFRVKDSGIGMDPEFQKKIFDTFTRAQDSTVQKIEGTGLGMAITKAIVETMKGTIVLTSAPGQGSEFHVTLDLEKAYVQEKDMVLPLWKMLVVDNNEDLCHSAVATLKEIGAEAEYALSGEEAVAMVNKHHQAGDDYQFVLLDWRMPGMDGMQTAQEIRKHVGENITILIISAYDWSDIEEEARKAGAQGFISKPLFKSNLYLGLSRYMEGEAVEETTPEAEQPQFVGKRILLAEDNDLNWEIAEELLSEAGFELERAENG
ncbi:MAG: response regulator, partial [Lachnospiraceae bacterium]|nr:response regulator [Lachnospiraceae bacterium]